MGERGTRLRLPKPGFVFAVVYAQAKIRFFVCYAEGCRCHDKWLELKNPFNLGAFHSGKGAFTDCRVEISAELLDRRQYVVRQAKRQTWMDVEYSILAQWERALRGMICELPKNGFRR